MMQLCGNYYQPEQEWLHPQHELWGQSISNETVAQNNNSDKK